MKILKSAKKILMAALIGGMFFNVSITSTVSAHHGNYYGGCYYHNGDREHCYPYDDSDRQERQKYYEDNERHHQRGEHYNDR